jgi:pentatricopeptide repeat protein
MSKEGQHIRVQKAIDLILETLDINKIPTSDGFWACWNILMHQCAKEFTLEKTEQMIKEMMEKSRTLWEKSDGQ